MKQETQHIVNLDLAPHERWLFLNSYVDEMNELLAYYLNDLKDCSIIFNGIEEFKKIVIPQEYLNEIEFIASISNYSANEVLIANLYYDAVKFYFGCTAFAVQNSNGILHARNLDWWTENNSLSKYSKTFAFQRNNKTIFKTIGWPGFVGALSGTKLGCFSLTLNAVLSKDSPEIAMPVSFLLRDVFAKANSFLDAKKLLEQTTIASDCLLLLSGINKDEMVVIERTPSRFASRLPENGYIVVANDYKKMENQISDGNSLQATSCGRFERTQELLDKKIPTNFDECHSILSDAKVKMGITVQQMVFNNNTGEMFFKRV